MIFLIDYDRESSQLIDSSQFDDSERSDAEKARLQLEMNYLSLGLRHEIVLLQAASESDLRKTHRRYFEELDQIVRFRDSGLAKLA